ncbi:MAG TPA: recombination mediator RecR [Patescibacteria group bacterium]|nr:recombination mediator RecR [Patescibacteria group bacterium]
MKTLPESIQKAIDAFGSLPGIGPKTAQRLAFYLLRRDKKYSEDIGQAIMGLKKNINICAECQNISDSGRCAICSDASRDRSIICVVEEPLDILAFEKSGYFKGLYHVLQGSISPVDGIGPDDLKIKELLERIGKDSEIKEIILATNPTTEGEATAMYIHRLIYPLGINITRIARGIPFGGDIEYADEVTLNKSLEGRKAY